MAKTFSKIYKKELKRVELIFNHIMGVFNMEF